MCSTNQSFIVINHSCSVQLYKTHIFQIMDSASARKFATVIVTSNRFLHLNFLLIRNKKRHSMHIYYTNKKKFTQCTLSNHLDNILREEFIYTYL